MNQTSRPQAIIAAYFAIAVLIGVWQSWGEGWFSTVIVCAITVFIASVILYFIVLVLGAFVPPENE